MSKKIKKDQKEKIIVVLGQTATGKSDLAVRLAKKINGEIISADSRQVYKGLDIGTGKITKKEMRSVPHYMLDMVSPKRQYTAAEYKKDAEHYVRYIVHKGRVPIVVGGTGFYIDALLGDMPLPQVPPNKKLRKELETKNAATLFAMLKKLDKRRSRTIDNHNKVRLIRAIEIAHAIGKVPQLKTGEKKYDVLKIGIRIPDKKLKQKIRVRLLKRMKRGMQAEAKKLHAASLSWKRMNELGLEYRYTALHLQGKISKGEMIKKLETAIWQYARRQKTWFRRDKEISWFNPNQYKKIEKGVIQFLSK